MRRFLILIVLLILCATIDARIAGWVHTHNLGPRIRSSTLAKIIKWPGDFRFTLGVATVILLVNLKKWRGAVAVLVAGMLSGLFYTLVKWSVGRTRPFPRNAAAVPAFELHPFRLGLRGLWAADNQSFPSGHACLAFATAAALIRYCPRVGYVAIGLAGLVSVERVVEGGALPERHGCRRDFWLFGGRCGDTYRTGGCFPLTPSTARIPGTH